MREKIVYRYADKHRREQMEDADLVQKMLYTTSLLDEVRNSLRDVEELEYEKFASTGGMGDVWESLEHVEYYITKLINDLRSE